MIKYNSQKFRAEKEDLRIVERSINRGCHCNYQAYRNKVFTILNLLGPSVGMAEERKEE